MTHKAKITFCDNADALQRISAMATARAHSASLREGLRGLAGLVLGDRKLPYMRHLSMCDWTHASTPHGPP